MELKEYVDPLSLKINPVTGKKFSKEYYEFNDMLQNEYKLPMMDKEVYDEIKEKIQSNDILIIESSTGSGKSIVFPALLQRLYDYKVRVLISQPRTVNIESTAEALSKQLDLEIGQEIGFQYRGGHEENPQKSLIHVVVDFFLIKLLSSSEEADEQRELEGIRKSDAEYDIFLVDECHERNVNMDIFMSAMKMYYRDFESITSAQSQPSSLLSLGLTPKKKRKKLILLSATLDVQKFVRYYQDVATVGHIKIERATQPIYNMYLDEDVKDKNRDTYNTHIIRIVKELLKDKFIQEYEKEKSLRCSGCSKDSKDCYDNSGRLVPCDSNLTGIESSETGDILVFVPFTTMANKLVRTFNLWAKGKNVKQWKRLKSGVEVPITEPDPNGKKYAKGVFFTPLSRNTNLPERYYITSSPEETYLKDGYTRRVIFSTPIAETGITITGIKFVIETGIANKIAFDPRKRRQMQFLAYIRKPSVIQRCGRAGRRAPGICIHVYSLDTYNNRFKTKIIPKIYTEDIHKIYLTLLYHTLNAKTSIHYLESFPDPIDLSLVSKATYDLYRMELIDGNKLSRKGMAVVNMGMDFLLAVTLIEAFKYKFSESMKTRLTEDELEDIRTNLVKHMIPIIALLSINPSLDNWVESKDKRMLFASKYGTIIAILNFYTYYYETFVKDNILLIKRSIERRGKEREKRHLFTTKLQKYCEDEGFNYYNLKDLLPEIFNITKRIKRGKDYYHEYKILRVEEKKEEEKREKEKKFGLQQKPEHKMAMMRHEEMEEKKRKEELQLSKDDIHRLIITAFANVFENNKAVYVPDQRSYVLDNGENIGPLPRSNYWKRKKGDPPPKMIGFIDLIYLERQFPRRGMDPKTTAPFVILL